MAELLIVLVLASGFALGVASTTTTTLTLSDSSVTLGTTVTLSASVSNGAPVTAGQVTFCDANATFCEDAAIVGTAQLTPTGVATIKLTPPVGSHSYKAIFKGTTTTGPSTSAVQLLNVTGTTTITISASGSTGNYTLTGTVVTNGTALSPTGSISFVDTNDNYTVGSATVGSAVTTQKLGADISYQAGAGPSYVQTGDFNGDGTMDLAVANWSDNSVDILLGNGDGTFQAPVRYGVGSSPASVSVGDLNGDGVLDLVVPNYYDNTVSVLLGNGDGTFQPQVTYGTGLMASATPVGVAIGDFNGDGVPDLAVAMYGGPPWNHGVTVLIGVGDGTFSPGGFTEIGQAALSVSTGDFNGDGKLDLAVPDYGGAIWILLGNGDGSFELLSENVIYDHIPSRLGVGDFNRDGLADLTGADPSENDVKVLDGYGNGTFNIFGPTYPVGNTPGSLSVADVNGDGILDLVVPNYSDNTVTLLSGNGDGTFTTQGTYPTTSTAGSVAVGDFNRDGLLDVAVVNVGTHTVGILLNNLVTTVTGEQSGISIPGTGTHEVRAIYSGDGTFEGSMSSTISLVGSPVSTTLTLNVTPQSSTYGEQVVLSASLNPASAGTLTTDREIVSFLDGATTLGTSMLSDGVAILPVVSLQAGAHSLTAVYGGDTSFIASSSPALPFSVGKAAPVLSLSPSSSAVFVQTAVTLTATLSSSAGMPTGSINFYDGSALLGAGTVAQGVARYTVPSLGLGIHPITAVYGGDGNFSGVTSSVVQESVEDFTIGIFPGSSASVTLTGGGTATYQILVTPSGGTTIPASLAFGATGVPSSAKATFTPQTMSAGEGETNVSLTIDVPGKAARRSPIFGFGLFAVAIGILVLPFTRRARKGYILGSIMLCMLCGCILTACGSGQHSASTPPVQPQVYTVVVTATSRTLSHSTNVTLILQ